MDVDIKALNLMCGVQSLASCPKRFELTIMYIYIFPPEN